MSPRIHINLRVSDLAASKQFYTALLGAPPDKVREDYARFQPADLPIALSLIPGGGDVAKGRIDHLGIRLDEDPESVWARLEAAGLAGREEQDVTCCYAVQDKSWFTDPDGHAWEVYRVTDEAPVSDSLRGNSPWKAEAASTCCATASPAKTSCC